MSGFATETLEKKLSELNNTQQSIQTLSLWLIHHRKHNKLIIQTWYKELKKVKPSKRLTFMYLANDVIQNSRKKGPEFTKEFISALKHAFEFVAKDADEKTMQSLDRIITIWNERNIYDSNLLAEFRKSLQNRTISPVKSNNQIVDKLKKRKDSNEETKVDESPSKKIRTILPSKSDIELPIKGEDVDSKDLINCLKSLENTASSDAVIRERIAKLPPEVSDTNLIDKIKDKNEAEQLSAKVDEACTILNDYNSRLAKELDDRKKISYKLAAFCRYQKEIQEQTQKTLSEYVERLNKVKRVKSELKLHLKNLPDLTKLPSLREAPLPNPNELFVSSKKDKEDEKSGDLSNNNSTIEQNKSKINDESKNKEDSIKDNEKVNNNDQIKTNDDEYKKNFEMIKNAVTV